MKKKIAIIGGIGTARNIIFQIQDAIKKYNYNIEIAGIIIDKPELLSNMPKYEVLGYTSDIKKLLENTDLYFVFCLYRMDLMKERWDLLLSYRIPESRLINFFHPLSYVCENIKTGTGNIILSNSSIQSNVVLGTGNIINSNVTIEHDTLIGNGCFISANACIGAGVSIGNNCFIGLNSSIRENTVIGNNVFVGMHSLVIDNAENCKLAGIPAKKI